MSAKAIYNFPGVPQLILKRTARLETCFFVDKDYLYYIEALGDCAKEFQCQIHAYALMPGQVYLLATSRSANGISNMIQALSARYLNYVSKTYGITGALWEGGYQSCLLEGETYLLPSMQYIETMPVREKLVTAVEQYTWSSFYSNALSVDKNIIVPHAGYLQLADNDSERIKIYRERFNQPLADSVVSEITIALKEGQVLGSSVFKDKIQQQLSNPAVKVNGECFDCVMFY